MEMPDTEPCPTSVLCLDDTCSYAQAEHLSQTLGYNVFVIGVGDVATTWQQVLSTLAQSGGTEDFYEVQEPADLQQVLGAITTSAVECLFDIPWDEIPSSTEDGLVEKKCNKVRVYGVPDETNPNQKQKIP